MSVSVQSLSANSSMNSSYLNSSDDLAVKNMKKYIKELLRSRIFLGRYLERRLVDKYIGYRDIVLISAAETGIKRDLMEALQKFRSIYPTLHWIGITDSDVISYNISPSVCLWTEIENQPLGPFWFQIKSIRYREHEILLTLHCLRHITDAFLELEPILTGATRKPNKNDENQVDDVKACINESYSDIKKSLKGALSIKNVKEFATFIFAFVIAIFTGSTTFVNFLGNFILAFMREISILIKNSTPMFLGFLDILSKIVGGFYILIAMIFRSNAPIPQNKRALNYDHLDRREFD